MENESYINCNGFSFIFIDTMFWFDIQKDKLLHEKFIKWLSLTNYEPIFHSNLLMELFHSSKKFDFEELWNIIEIYSFSNFCPINIIEEEIHMVYQKKQVFVNEILKNSVFKLNDSDRKKLKTEYLKNSGYLREYMKTKGGPREAYIKALSKISSINPNKNIYDILSENKIKSPKKSLEKLIELIIDNVKSKDYKKFDLQNKTTPLIEKFVHEEFNETTINRDIQVLLDSGFYNYEKVPSVKIKDYIFHIGYFQLLKNTFENSYPEHQWLDFIENLREYKQEKFPGYNIHLKTSELIRKSSAKFKISDTIDFLNLTYLPYCELYVSDAHIIDSIKQVDNTFSSKVLNLKNFKELINTTHNTS